jgi:hypothetical protein
LHPKEDVELEVRIWNKGDKDLFISKTIDNLYSNGLATLQLDLYQGDKFIPDDGSIVGDSFSSQRPAYPPLVTELPRYWVPLPPKHYYGGVVLMHLSSYKTLKIPGKCRIEGIYRSRGFLAESINNPLLHYAEELRQLPYGAWVGEVKTNSIWLEIAR